MKTIITRLSILATLQVVGFVGSFGILNASAAGEGLNSQFSSLMGSSASQSTSSQIRETSLEIKGFAPSDDNCLAVAKSNCTVNVHYDVKTDSKISKVAIYLTGPETENEMIGENEIQSTEEGESTFVQPIQADVSGFHVFKVVGMDSSNVVHEVASAGFYATRPNTDLNLSASLASIDAGAVTEDDTEDSSDENSSNALQITPVPARSQEAIAQTAPRSTTRVVASTTKTVTSTQTRSTTSSSSSFTFNDSKAGQPQDNSSQPATPISTPTPSNPQPSNPAPTQQKREERRGIDVNFSAPGLNVDGHYNDNGQMIGSRDGGWTYGWSRDWTSEVVNVSSSDYYERYHEGFGGYAQFGRDHGVEWILQNIPNGNYEVEVIVGDTLWDLDSRRKNKHHIVANGETIALCYGIGYNKRFCEDRKTINVTNGQIKVSQGDRGTLTNLHMIRIRPV